MGHPHVRNSSPVGVCAAGPGPSDGVKPSHPWQMQSLPAALERQLVGEQDGLCLFLAGDIGPVPPLGLAGLLS